MITFLINREIRKVPGNWLHPKDDNGEFIPLFEANDKAEEGDEEFDTCYMPSWDKKEQTHFMLYETTSEGTPLTPAFDSEEKLIHWIVNNNISFYGHETANYDKWMEALS